MARSPFFAIDLTESVAPFFFGKRWHRGWRTKHIYLCSSSSLDPSNNCSSLDPLRSWSISLSLISSFLFMQLTKTFSHVSDDGRPLVLLRSKLNMSLSFYFVLLQLATPFLFVCILLQSRSNLSLFCRGCRPIRFGPQISPRIYDRFGPSESSISFPFLLQFCTKLLAFLGLRDDRQRPDPVLLDLSTWEPKPLHPLKTETDLPSSFLHRCLDLGFFHCHHRRQVLPNTAVTVRWCWSVATVQRTSVILALFKKMGQKSPAFGWFCRKGFNWNFLQKLNSRLKFFENHVLFCYEAISWGSFWKFSYLSNPSPDG